MGSSDARLILFRTGTADTSRNIYWKSPEGMKKADSWIEILLEANELHPETLQALSAALVDRGSCGAAFDEQTMDSSSVVPICEACGHRTRIKVYFPDLGRVVEETLAAVEHAVTQTMQIYEGLDARILRVHTIGCQDWAEEWKAYFSPQRIGERIVVAPPWDIPKVPPEAILMLIDPGKAFGTGQHPSTALCLEFLDEIARSQGGLPVSFLDVGYGSGILCIAAYKLGARKVLGVDIDPDVAEDAVKNFALNHLKDRIILVSGAPQCVRISFDIVAANLDSRLLQQSVAWLTEHVKDTGSLVLSGILDEEVAEIRLVYEAAGFCTMGEKIKDEWGALFLRRKAAQPM